MQNGWLWKNKIINISVLFRVSTTPELRLGDGIQTSEGNCERTKSINVRNTLMESSNKTYENN